MDTNLTFSVVLSLFFGLSVPASALETGKAASPPGAGRTGGASAAGKRAVKAGDLAPAFALRQFGGDFVFLKNYCGKTKKFPTVKAVMLDFFATDCVSCVAQLGRLQTLAGQYSPGLETLLISIDPQPEEVLPAFLKEEGVELPVLTDMYRKTLSKYGFRSVPKAVLVDGDCKVVYVAEDEKGYSVIADSLKTLLE